MNNYPNGVKPSDFDAPVFEYKTEDIEIEDFEHDYGIGLKTGSLFIEAERMPSGELMLADTGVFMPVGNNGEELPEVKIDIEHLDQYWQTRIDLELNKAFKD